MAVSPNHWLAQFLPDRVGANCARPDGPLLGAGIAALADPNGAARGRAQIARLGIAGRSERHRFADNLSRSGEDTVAGAVQIPAQCRCRLSDRPNPDWRRRAGTVADDIVRAGLKGHAGRSLVSGDLGQRVWDRWAIPRDCHYRPLG